MAAMSSIEDGKKFMKQGHKLAKGGIFSKANPDDAEKMYEKARKKVCTTYDGIINDVL